MRRILVTAFVVAAALATGAPTVHASTDELEKAAKKWDELMTKRDPAIAAGLYAKDCILMPPNAATMRGLEAATAEWKGMFDMGLQLKLENLETEVVGDLGYRTGVFRVLDPAGEEIDRGKYIELWRKIGKAWLITHDIWNSDMPLPEPHQH